MGFQYRFVTAIFIAFTFCGCTTSGMTVGSKQKSDQDMKECAFGSEQKYGLSVSGSSDWKTTLSAGGSYDEAFKASVLHDQSISDDVKKLVVEHYYDCLKKK